MFTAMLEVVATAGLAFPEWSPALLTIPEFDLFGRTFGPFPLRWYALGYLAGIVGGFWYMNRLVRRERLWGGATRATPEALEDLLFWAILGIILGGRLGYILFYMLPFDPGAVMRDPMVLIRIWDGGMSFHGGLLGVAGALLYTSRKHKVPLFALTDLAACAAPIGIGLVRVANFMNAELYGRATNGPMGMVFPQGRSPAPGGPPEAYNWETGQWVYSGLEGPRHPSQLYEAALEGFLLFAVLAALVWLVGILRRPGLATGIFLLGYGLGRTIAENFREPDAHIGFLNFLPFPITMGMVLSAPMYLGGAWLVWQALRSHPPASPQASGAA
jgi:phosphatidylglycerol:prolipoprotein diacylglycerol transferase